jgi:ABC-type Fe3+ transport system permease subunit
MNSFLSIPPFLTALEMALRRWLGLDQRSASTSRELPELAPWKIIWGAWFTCALLAAFGLPYLHA